MSPADPLLVFEMVPPVTVFASGRMKLPVSTPVTFSLNVTVKFTLTAFVGLGSERAIESAVGGLSTRMILDTLGIPLQKTVTSAWPSGKSVIGTEVNFVSVGKGVIITLIVRKEDVKYPN